MTNTEVLVFADIVCPFTHVGLTRLFAEREQRGASNVTIEVCAWPLEMVNGEMMDPVSVGHKIEGLRNSVAPDLFTGFDPTTWPSTSLPALELTSLAYAKDLTTGETVSLALRRLLFEEGLDISDASVLATLADAHGLPHPDYPTRALAEFEDGKLRQVKGSPHFFCDGYDQFCPTLTITATEDGYDVAYDESLLAEFMGAIFAPTAP